MQTTTMFGKTLTAASALMFLACTADIHDNNFDIDGQFNIDKAAVEFSSGDDLSAIEAGKTFSVSIDATNVFLVEPSATPPERQAANAGHFIFYLDDFAGAQLLVTAATTVTLTVPAGTPEGPHKVKCRIHKHDGSPTSATFEIDITVRVAVIGNPSDAGS